MKRLFRWLGLLVVLALILATFAPALALDRETRLDVLSAVVQVSWVILEGDGAYGVGVGSGTIVSPEGLILTNCHVADPLLFGIPAEQVPDFDYLGVSLTIRSDQPPQPAYLAEVVAADPILDLAVIRVSWELDRSAVDAADLNLPWVELGDSDGVEVGDELNIFGYPGIGGETITFTKGVVAGFSLDSAIEGRAWIKTDATIAGGNSGGTAVDEQGYLVGVPTRAGAGGGADYVDCRPLADTNGDGRIDDDDTCIPIGGFINALRPVKLAQPLVEAARTGLAYVTPSGKSDLPPAPTGQPAFYSLIFSPGVNEFGQPTSVVRSLPSGATSLYLFFDYDNMAPGMTLEMTVSIDGQEYPDWGLPAGPWGGEEEGTWWIGWSDAEFADGRYELALLVDGEELASEEIEIGGPQLDEPTFSDIVIGLEEASGGEPLESAVLFPSGVAELMALFDYENMSLGMEWEAEWLVNGDVELASEDEWEGNDQGRWLLRLTDPAGLESGTHRLNLSIEGQLAATARFWVTGSEGAAAEFQPLVFAEGVDGSGEPRGVAVSFDSGLEELHAFSDYTGMEDGLAFGVNWYFDGQLVIDSPYDWDGGESGTWHDYVYTGSGVLPDGEYFLELMLEGQTVASGTAAIGITGLPTPGPTPSPEGLQVEGRVLDLDTERPISGALVLVLNPGVTLRTFEWTYDEVYTSAETDRQGFFELPDPLEVGACYTVVVGADGYWTFAQDEVCIDVDDGPVAEWTISLEKE